MKKSLAVFILSILGLIGSSQSYYPLLESENTWDVLSVEIYPPPPFDTVYSTTSYRIINDTLIGSTHYKKLYSSSEVNPYNWQFYCFMREDSSKKVWLRYDTSNEEYPMYDFSINTGDTIQVGKDEPVELVVDSITNVPINGTNRNKFWFSCLINPDYDEFWIEGIGSNQGIIWSGSAMLVGGFYRLLCMSQDEIQYFMNPNYNTCYLNTVGVDEIDQISHQIYPNPSCGGIIHIKYLGEMDIERITVIDFSGKTVLEYDEYQEALNISSLAKGIYVVKIIIEQNQYVKKIILK